MAEQRSKSYPAIPITDAVVRIKELYKKLGDSKSYHKDNFATGLGYKDATNGAFLRMIAALSQYGLVKKDGNDYKLTDLSRRILIPTTETAEEEATREAALAPSVFKSIYERYSGQDLPILLPNILVTDFGILDGAKNKVTSIFRQSMEHVGLLNGNSLGNLDSDDIPAADQVEDVFEDGTLQRPASSVIEFSSPSTTAPSDEVNKFEIVLREGTKAGIFAPYGLTQDEKDKLKSLIDLM